MGDIHAVRSVSSELQPGELLGVAGESGSWKSVAMMSLIGLLPTLPAEMCAGSVLFGGQDLMKLSQRKLQTLRGRDVGFVFQDAMTSLNPVFTVGFRITEPRRKHMGMNKARARQRAAELVELVGNPDASRRLRDFHHQFSGGMRQRGYDCG